MRALTAAATTNLLPPAQSVSASPEFLDAPAIIPLSLCGGAYCLGYSLDGHQFRAVVDTGSPFILVDGSCDTGSQNNEWGCYRGMGRPSGLPDTDELFGGMDVGVEWRRGRLALNQVRVDDRLRLTAEVDDACFGVVRSYVGKGGGGAVFLGLAKRRLPRIRPTLLEQTDVVAMRFDFLSRRMELSRRALIPRRVDAVRLLDLRPRGAPVANYAARASRLIVNGMAVPLDRQLVVIIDTGTTGISVDERLLDAGLVDTRWADATIELPTEGGSSCQLVASVRKRKLAGPRIPITAEEFDEFPLIVSPIRVPWFDPGFGQMECADGSGKQCNGQPLGAPPPILDRLRQKVDGLGEAPYILFVGLAFLWRTPLTIDIDDGRMLVGDPDEQA